LSTPTAALDAIDAGALQPACGFAFDGGDPGVVVSFDHVRTKAPREALEQGARRAYHAVRRFVWDLMAHDAFGASASIAFWFFLSLVPLLALAGFLIGQVARTRGVDALVEPILEVAPGSANGLVSKELLRMAGSGGAPLAPLGVLGFMWTASQGLHNLMDVFETTVKAKRRPWWKQRAIALGWVLLGLGASCGLALVLVRADAAMNTYETARESVEPAPSASAHDRTAHAAATPRPKPSLRKRVHGALTTPDEKAFAAVLLLLTGFGFLAGFYRFAVEHPPGIKRVVLPGALTALASWLIVSWAFGDYAGSIADYALYYGGLAAVAILLVWLYLTSLSLVVGAEVNAQLEGLRSRRASRPDV
jgi:membrane protein